jgi:BirA family biotin operon repressor/biotin-[acetyl-CoA-carboxylase] ligase
MIKQIINLDKVTSTQDVAKALAAAGEEGGTFITASSQSSGRGQYGKSWNSAAGGLYMSLILRPEKEIKYASALSMRVADTINRALSSMFPVKTKIKHPNDILAYEPESKKWKKICGILIESSSTSEKLEWLVIGAGVNVNNKTPSAINAVSLKELLGAPQSLSEVKMRLLDVFAREYQAWLNTVS